MRSLNQFTLYMHSASGGIVTTSCARITSPAVLSAPSPESELNSDIDLLLQAIDLNRARELASVIEIVQTGTIAAERAPSGATAEPVTCDPSAATFAS